MNTNENLTNEQRYEKLLKDYFRLDLSKIIDIYDLDFYEVLNLPFTTKDAAKIEACWDEKYKSWETLRPDSPKYGPIYNNKEVQKIKATITKAKPILLDAEKRAKYDKDRKEKKWRPEYVKFLKNTHQVKPEITSQEADQFINLGKNKYHLTQQEAKTEFDKVGFKTKRSASTSRTATRPTPGPTPRSTSRTAQKSQPGPPRSISFQQFVSQNKTALIAAAGVAIVLLLFKFNVISMPTKKGIHEDQIYKVSLVDQTEQYYVQVLKKQNKEISTRNLSTTEIMHFTESEIESIDPLPTEGAVLDDVQIDQRIVVTTKADKVIRGKVVQNDMGVLVLEDRGAQTFLVKPVIDHINR